jgi:hypothetical protein
VKLKSDLQGLRKVGNEVGLAVELADDLLGHEHRAWKKLV